MANEIILLDTDFFIEYKNDNQEAVKIVENSETTFIALGATTFVELIKGAQDKKQLDKVLKITQNFHIIQIDEDISEKAIDLLITYHLSKSAAFNDSLLAATAIKYGCKLATCNKKHFEYIPNLLLLPHNVVPKRKSW